MVTNNKVLTVSYGTFSCTLEGFEESFDTMKAIAEYFRDLAADDRYFGAEPPTPDAEMLTRIAEREIERRVQARHEHGAIVLSATDPSVAAQAPAPEPIAEAPAVVEPEIEADVQDVADQAIANAVAETAVEEDVADAPEVLEADVDAAPEMEAEEAVVETAAVEEIVEDAVEETVEDAVAENLFDEDFDLAPSEAAAPVADDAEDSIAAKLRRIRAVVSRAEIEDDEDEDFIEDQHAEDMAAETDIEPAPVMQDVEEDDAEDALEVEMPAAVAPTPAPRARVIRMKRAEFEEAVADGLIEEDHLDDDAEDDVAVAAPSSSLSDEDEADLMAQLAEVDAEIQDEAPEAQEEEDFAEPDVAEAEPEFEDDMPIPVTPKRARRSRRAALETQEAGEEAVDRLIEEANSKLDEPEGNRRRNAIAHLRAAVAATKAEKDAGSSLSKEDNSDAYRDDLASAMRPQKPRSEEDAPARRSAAPLKLVPAQRIDQPEDTAAKPVRPRRVAVDDVAAMDANEKSADFVEFAENMGATQLPEVLEAAASYLTFVEGRRRFSRPMLMRLAYQVGEERFEREAGLRSFGQLLRDKKIEKIAGGRFTVSDSISFKPEDGDREVG